MGMAWRTERPLQPARVLCGQPARACSSTSQQWACLASVLAAVGMPGLRCPSLTCAAATGSGRARCRVGWTPSPPLHGEMMQQQQQRVHVDTTVVSGAHARRR